MQPHSSVVRREKRNNIARLLLPDANMKNSNISRRVSSTNGDGGTALTQLVQSYRKCPSPSATAYSRKSRSNSPCAQLDSAGTVSPNPEHDPFDSGSSHYTVDAAISAMGVGWFQYRLCFLTGAINAADAMEMMLLSFLIPKLKAEWDLSPPWDGCMGAIVFMGQLLGTSAGAFMSDKYGRRIVTIGSTVGCAIFGTLSAFAYNLPMMLALRFLVGVFVVCDFIPLSMYCLALQMSFQCLNLHFLVILTFTPHSSVMLLFKLKTLQVTLSVVDVSGWKLRRIHSVRRILSHAQSWIPPRGGAVVLGIWCHFQCLSGRTVFQCVPQ